MIKSIFCWRWKQLLKKGEEKKKREDGRGREDEPLTREWRSKGGQIISLSFFQLDIFLFKLIIIDYEIGLIYQLKYPKKKLFFNLQVCCHIIQRPNFYQLHASIQLNKAAAHVDFHLF